MNVKIGWEEGFWTGSGLRCLLCVVSTERSWDLDDGRNDWNEQHPQPGNANPSRMEKTHEAIIFDNLESRQFDLYTISKETQTVKMEDTP